jgi:hypothetical protein
MKILRLGRRLRLGRGEPELGWKSRFLHCTTHDETVSRFGRNDNSLVSKQLFG